MQRLAEALNDDLAPEELRAQLICVVSPVKKILVSKNNIRVGYTLSYEHNYWAGYEKLGATQLNDADLSAGFTVEGPDGVVLFIEPLTDVPNFHHQFTHIRVEACLRQCFGASTRPQINATLTYATVQEQSSELSTLVQDKSASIAKLRQFYIASKIQTNWRSGRFKITNMELKRYMEAELGKEIKNGYQITSYAPRDRKDVRS